MVARALSSSWPRTTVVAVVSSGKGVSFNLHKMLVRSPPPASPVINMHPVVSFGVFVCVSKAHYFSIFAVWLVFMVCRRVNDPNVYIYLYILWLEYYELLPVCVCVLI